jgi:hypothetical protein
MEAFLMRVGSTVVEAAVVSPVLIGLLLLVRRVQIAMGMKDESAPSAHTPTSL